MTVNLCTIHHEGAGAPTNTARGANGGYSIWIGSTSYTVLRPPETSFATLHFNGKSLDICLSGNRMIYPVSDADIALIRAAVSDVRARGWVVDTPEVQAHKFSQGSSTVCPGDLTMVRWPDVVQACKAAPLVIVEGTIPMFYVGRRDLLGRYSGKQVRDGVPVYGYSGLRKVFKQGLLAKLPGHALYVRLSDKAHVG